MGLIISPTGKGVRNDAGGYGFFQASRGDRLHNGTDFDGAPGQTVVAPVQGIITRYSYPYADSQIYSGVFIEGQQIGIKLWYFDPNPNLIGHGVRASIEA